MSKTNQTNRRGNGIPEERSTAAMEETLRLYHAWLGYLLTLQGEEVLRVKAADIRRALEALSCSVTREGDEYVIRLQGGGEAEHEQQAGLCSE